MARSSSPPFTAAVTLSTAPRRLIVDSEIASRKHALTLGDNHRQPIESDCAAADAQR